MPGAVKTAYEKFADQIPLIHEVQLVMPADTTVETAVEIDTAIPPGGKVGWVIYGIRWLFQNVAAPYARIQPGIATDAVLNLQLCRGDVPGTPVRLSRSDSDLIVEDIFDISVATAVGVTYIEWPRLVRRSAVTQLPKLYLMFVSDVDVTNISAATTEIFAEILYHLVDAPKAQRERL